MRLAVLALTALLAHPAGAAEWKWALPPHFPPPPIAADNPMSTEKMTLGRHLFHDPRLSGNGSTSCASCHFESLGFSDGRATSPGATGQSTHRNAPGLVNLAWMSTYTWANPALTTLERQAEVPLFGDDPVEMGVTDANRDEVLNRLHHDPDYPRQFAQAFPDRPQPISFDSITKALAAFQRSLISATTRYDSFLAGDVVLSASELHGMAIFFGPIGGCGQCHGGFNFTDHLRGTPPLFHDASVHGIHDTVYPNRGLFELTGRPEDLNRFRTPGLRDISRTAPYMHDGRYPDLNTVLQRYARRQFSSTETKALLDFLGTLGN